MRIGGAWGSRPPGQKGRHLVVGGEEALGRRELRIGLELPGVVSISHSEMY